MSKEDMVDLDEVLKAVTSFEEKIREVSPFYDEAEVLLALFFLGMEAYKEVCEKGKDELRKTADNFATAVGFNLKEV